LDKAEVAVLVKATLAGLSAIEGLDVERGLKSLKGDPVAYLRLLRLYAVDHLDDVSRLREHFSCGDRAGVERLPHTLKSISGTLGAIGMQRIATELEAAIKNSHDANEIDQLASALEAESHRLMAAILAVLTQNATVHDAFEIDWMMVQQVLAELEPLLEEGNIRVNQLVEIHSALLSNALGPLANELEHRIDHFLYREASETINRARNIYPQLALH